VDKPNASQTAIRVATLRAAHQILDGEPKILVDPISIVFLRRRARLQSAPMPRD